MILLKAERIRKFFGPEPVLNGVGFELRPGQRAALVGPNGAGKSTLLKILAGREDLDSGSVQIHSSATVGYLEQQPTFAPGVTVWDVAQEGLSSLLTLSKEAEDIAHQLATETDAEKIESIGHRYEELQHELKRLNAYHLDHRLEEVLEGLGFARDVFEQPVNTLSGGQQNRLQLARLLLSRPDVLLLDEPSNHLDIEATQWLEDYLAASDQAMIVVSHDRYFLDKTANRVLELFDGTIDEYTGNFTSYWKQKAERLEVQSRTYEKQQEEIAKLEDFVRRNHYGQKSAQAEDRRKKLERIERIAAPRTISAPAMRFPDADRIGDIALRVEHLSKGFDRPLFSDLSFDVLRGERWGVVGPNGSGKTTLLKCLLRLIKPDEGQVILGTHVRMGYFDQQLAGFDDNLPVIEAVRPDNRDMKEQERRDALASFGIQGDMAYQKIGSLSGGERNRTALTRLALSEANFLLLDEPTNHLDLWSRDALERALKSFNGTVVFVSHDRYFVNQTADHVLVVDGDRFRVVEGNYDVYRHMSEQGIWREPGKKAETSSKGAKQTKAANTSSAPAPDGTAKRKRKFPYRKTVQIEKDIANQERELQVLHDRLCLPEVLRDGEAIKRLKADIEAAEAAIALLYEHWEEASELN